MASFTERLAFLISVKADEAVRDLKKFGSTADREMSKAENRMLKMSGAANNLSKTVALPVVAGLTAATVAASGLQQAVGGTEAVFGGASDAIDDYAKDAAQGAGLSERAFRDATTQIGGQLKRMTGDVGLAAEQSVELTKIGADLAATYGGTTAEAVDALSSAFRGEADPAERFNLNLKASVVNAKAVEMGLARTTTEVSENAKAQATLALIYEQSKDAQGQFARESDSAAGAMQRAQASIENSAASLGENLLPAAAGAADKVAFLAENFSELPSAVQQGVLALAGIAVASGPILTVVGNLGKLRDRLKEIDGAALASKAGVLGFATAVVGAAYMIDQAIAGIGADVDAIFNEALEMGADEFADRFTGAASDLALFEGIVAANVGTAMRFRDAIAAQGGDVSELNEIIDRHLDRQKQLAEDAERAAGALGGEADAALDAAAAITNYDSALDATLGAHLDLSEAGDKLADVEERVRESLDGTGSAARGAAQDITTYQEALDDTLGAALDVDMAHESAADAVRGLAEALGQAGAGSESGSDFMTRFYGGAADAADEAGQSIVEATANAVRAAKDEVDAMAESGEIADTAEARKQALLDRLVDLKEQFPQVAGQIDKYIGSVSNLSGDLPTVERRTQDLTRANVDLEESARDLVGAAEDQADAVKLTGTEAEKARQKHFLLLGLLEDLKVKFPELATIIDTYVADVSKAWTDYLRATDPEFRRDEATARNRGPGLPGMRDGYGAAGVSITQHIYGDGLNSAEVAELSAKRTQRALVGSRVG